MTNWLLLLQLLRLVLRNRVVVLVIIPAAPAAPPMARTRPSMVRLHAELILLTTPSTASPMGVVMLR